ncbi:hypothetical protein C1645_842246 [Glomus cerebriforme]|uniref:Uncharacterized protein n=1 Tax=Glomus cerebriforme TaxID=658196 RepID=A0A397RZW7_9GLOM|nr:hypothetical protein C1645_842246 [Glomus cerebriforme]
MIESITSRVIINQLSKWPKALVNSIGDIMISTLLIQINLLKLSSTYHNLIKSDLEYSKSNFG